MLFRMKNCHIRLAGVCIGLLAVTSAGPARAASNVPSHDTPASLQSSYAALACQMADCMLQQPDQRPWLKDLTQILAEGNAKILACKQVSLNSADPTVLFVATEATEASSALLKAHQELAFAVDTDDALQPLLAMGAGFLLRDAGAVVQGASELLQPKSGMSPAQREWVRAFVRHRAAQLLLPSIASRCAGPDVEGPAPLAVDIDEAFADASDHDLIKLTNASGRELHHCTVLVELRGRDGGIAQNVHFVPIWKPGETRYAPYGIGVQTDRDNVGQQTVYGIEQVHVSLWSDELRRESWVYEYPGAERERDRRALLESTLKYHCQYVPTPIFGQGRCLDLWYEGIGGLPPHTVTMTFRRDGHESRVSWLQDEWRPAWRNQRRFDTRQLLTFDPHTVDIELTFPDDAGPVCKHTIRLPHP